MKAEPPAFEELLYPVAPFFKPPRLIMEQRKIVCVTQVSSGPEDLLAEVVKAVQIDVCESDPISLDTELA